MSFGRAGVICTWTFHSCPEIRGCTGMYCTARVNLTGRRQNFTTLAKPRPTGTVQTSSDGAVQSARMLPEYPRLQPSPKKIVAIGCKFIWFVSGRPCSPPMDHHCWGKHADEVTFGEVTHHDAGSELALALDSEV